jgi:membrane-associated phospholipid phosphatase
MRARQIAIGSLTIILAAACGDQNPTMVDPALQVSEGAPFSSQVATLGWQARARTLVAAGSLSPLAAARIYAALSVAQYNAVTTVQTLESDGVLSEGGFGTGGRTQFEAERAAIAGASVRVLSFFFPAAAATLEQQVIAEGNEGAGEVHPQFILGLASGRSAGDASIRHVQGDRFTSPWTGTVPTGPGLWTANGPPAGATLGGAVPYFMTSGSQFRPVAPPAFMSPEFNAALAEVKTLSADLTPAQIANVRFWNYGGGTPTPPGYFNEVASTYSVEARMDEAATAHVFAVMHAALFDALIACWDAKYHYWLLRPSQVDPTIPLPLGLPNHPSYPSGHSCVSSAAGTVLTHFFPSHASELATTVEDAGMSRIRGGIHYRFDISAGNRIGRSVGQLAIATGF